MNLPRCSGVLLHPTSLPGRQPVGSLGESARRFVDFLAAAGQSVWQILPLGPPGYGDCPYSCYSAFAGNPLLIDLELLAVSGDLCSDQLPPPAPPSERADIRQAQQQQIPLLKQAWQNFSRQASSERRLAFETFCREQELWLEDYARFQALRQQLGPDWHDWPAPIRHRDNGTLLQIDAELTESIAWHKYLQFVFFEQWLNLKDYAHRKGIRIFGDLPIFVAGNSADVWANRRLFYLDEADQPTLVAGVPPDYFSTTGQRWGNPLYCWEQLAVEDYAWWLERFAWNLQLFDLVRVDHFRGFESCWAIPAEESTAVNGSWMPVPGEELFGRLEQRFGELPIVAEDLGFITPEVEQLRDRFKLPGMKILQFAFDSGPGNPYLPHNHIPNSVVYTGTHDNQTSLGWWQDLPEIAQQRVINYLKKDGRRMPRALNETALASVAKLAVIPMQDILGLDDRARMNRPGTATGNWHWRLRTIPEEDKLLSEFRDLTHLYGRLLCNPTEMH